MTFTKRAYGCQLFQRRHPSPSFPLSAYSAPLALRDYLKPYLRLLGAWDRRHLYALCRSILQSRSSILSRSGRTRLQRQDGMHARLDNWVKRMSSLIERLPWEEVERAHWRRLRERHAERPWHLVIHDMSDIAKPFAKKLEGLSTVHDGSTDTLVSGYVFCQSIGIGRKAWDIHPIATELLNPLAENFLGQNDVFKQQVSRITDAGIGEDLLHVFDCGFDDEKWFHFLDSEQLAWMIRLKDNRNVIFRGEEHPITVVVETMLAEERSLLWEDVTYARSDIGIILEHDGAGKKIKPETRMYALIAVRRPQFKKPMLLLLNGRVKNVREAVKRYEEYLERFDIEHCLRFGKQALKLEQMQLRSFERLRRFLQLQMLLVDFLLREYDKGVRPPGAELREILQRSIDGDTRILSPYLLADHLGDTLRATQRFADPDLVPRVSPQLCLLPVMDTE